MSKREGPNDEPADMEVGMTTAERRRRRRRGGSLRVPSDNVPRRATTAPPVVAPIPEDPALAMSIAYSFTNDASEPHPRIDMPPPTPGTTKPPPMPASVHRAPTVDSATGKEVDVHVRRTVVQAVPELDDDDEAEMEVVEEATEFGMPVAPESMPTVIDPPSSSVEEPQEFEMKTREMSAVDLDALGLSELRSISANSANSSPSVEISIIREPSVVIAPPRSNGQPGDEETVTKMVEVRFKPAHRPSAAMQPLQRPAEAVPPLVRATPRPITARPVEIEVDVDSVDAGTTLDTEVIDDADEKATQQMSVMRADTANPVGEARPRRERIKTVALSDDDLEEVREVVRSMSEPRKSAAAEPAKPTRSETSAKSEEVLSVPDIDIQLLSERSESADFEVDVEMSDVGPKPVKPVEPPRTMTPPPMDPARTSNPELRPRSASQPPPMGQSLHTHAAPPPPPGANKAPPAPPAPPPAAAKKPAPSSSQLAAQAKDGKPRGKPWFVDLFDEDYLRTLPFLTPQATQAEAEFVIDAMGLQPGAQVLDIGCGYGRHAMELAARGFHMVGLDLSTPLLVRGGEEAHRRGLTINFVRGDMRELDFDAQFDGAYCLFSTFGYFDDETNKKTIANIARALRPGGRVMIEILNRDYVIADLPTRIWWEGEGCVVLEEVELNYFSSRIQVNRSVVFDDGRQLEQEISVRAYSLHEVGKLMHAAGFRVLEVSGGYQTRGRFFGNQSRHIIVLAERKDTPAT